ncbi:MAG: 3-phosphoshikimate 1-carboxyvinyltransferase [Actinomycetaceae bacterium]|nr:3-phosphoshikimate 1-carboxyvinyltransferase [Actinomycetaceae bacterium]
MSLEDKGNCERGEVWQAPAMSKPIDATVVIPGSKSLTNRYFALAALCDEPTRIHTPLIARDTILMAHALESMGVKVDLSEDVTTITPAPLHGGTIDVGLAGTVMRFIPALAMLAEGTVHIDGDEGARQRPMGAIVDGLRQLGVRVEAAQDANGDDVLPLDIHGKGASGLEGSIVDIDASASSQFISALMLAAPGTPSGLDIRHHGDTIPSAPHLGMTVDVLRKAGITVETFSDVYSLDNVSSPASYSSRWVVTPGTPTLGEVTVEPDLSNAGPFLAAAMLTGGTVRIPNYPKETTQPGAFYRYIFEGMGAKSTLKDGVYELRAGETIRGIDMDMHDYGELVPTVAAVCAFAESPSFLRNIGQLRWHETDRLAALERELQRLGCKATVRDVDLHIEPAPLHPACLRTYKDHRMATFGAIIGLRVPGVEVENIATTAKTFPQFAQMWGELVGGASEVRPSSVDVEQAEHSA